MWNGSCYVWSDKDYKLDLMLINYQGDTKLNHHKGENMMDIS